MTLQIVEYYTLNEDSKKRKDILDENIILKNIIEVRTDGFKVKHLLLCLFLLFFFPSILVSLFIIVLLGAISLPFIAIIYFAYLFILFSRKVGLTKLLNKTLIKSQK